MLSSNTKTPRAQVPGSVLDARADVSRHVGPPEGLAVGSLGYPSVVFLRPLSGLLLLLAVLGRRRLALCRRLDVTSLQEAVRVQQVHRYDHQRPHGYHRPLDHLKMKYSTLTQLFHK